MSLADKLAVFDAHLPLERARTIPSLWYFDDEIYRAECERVFGATWQCVGRADQLSRPGCYLTAEVAGQPILVVRGDDGVLRAFANVCRHKAALVMTDACGQASRLRCGYHGWTYDLAGRLRGTPQFEGVADFSRQENGLPAYTVDACGPLVFVHLGTPRASLADSLGPFAQAASQRQLEQLKFACRREYDLACNWKVFIDNYQDGGYHVPALHPALSGALDYKDYRTENFARGSVQISPMKPSDDPAVRAVRSGAVARYWWLFPNLMVNVYEGVMDVNVVLPLAPERCRVIFDFYFADVDSPGREKFIADSTAVAHQVQLEDQTICEQVQRGLGSRSYDTGRYSAKRESGCYHFHRLLAAYLRGSPNAATV